MAGSRFLLALIVGELLWSVAHCADDDSFDYKDGQCYIGCYKDNGHRDFQKKLSGKYTVKTCRPACGELDFKYFSLQYGDECFCDHDYATPANTYVKVDDDECIRDGHANGEGHGGAWRNSVYKIDCPAAEGREDEDESVDSEEESKKEIDSDVAAMLKKNCYVGCFVDNGHRDFEKRIAGKFTIKTCRPKCKELGFDYFAIQYGEECWCDEDYSTPPETYKKVDDDECIRDGHANGQGHGGAWRNSVYDTDCEGGDGDDGKEMKDIDNRSDFDKMKEESCYIGCFVDNGHRDFEKKLNGKFKVETCRPECKKLGYDYFSVQYGDECFCDDDYSTPPDTYKKVDDDECIRPGHANGEGHGGAWRNSVYAVSCKGREEAEDPEKYNPNEEVPEKFKKECYIGCFKDNGHRDFEKMLKGGYSVATCRAACDKLNYKYFSVQYGNECFCDKDYATPADTYVRVKDEECVREGYAEGHGGAWRNSVYNTKCETAAKPEKKEEIPDDVADEDYEFDPEEQCYVGCYKDNGHRDFQKMLSGKYTIDTCRPACEKLKYKYFSMQYGHECFCDNDYATPPDTYVQVKDEECIRKGYAEGHGGAWRNSVFKTVCDYIEDDSETPSESDDSPSEDDDSEVESDSEVDDKVDSDDDKVDSDDDKEPDSDDVDDLISDSDDESMESKEDECSEMSKKDCKNAEQCEYTKDEVCISLEKGCADMEGLPKGKKTKVKGKVLTDCMCKQKCMIMEEVNAELVFDAFSFEEKKKRCTCYSDVKETKKGYKMKKSNGVMTGKMA